MSMLALLWLVVASPLAGFVGIVLAGSRISERAAGRVGTATMGLAAVFAALVAAAFFAAPPPHEAYTQTLWRWMDTDGLRAEMSLRLDALSLVLVLLVTFVGFLIHLYSTEFMAEEAGRRRFFATMNLFVASMLVLLLAGDFLLLFLGWEGVGLASFLLIGFWYEEQDNVRAAQKAFLVTRVGDVALVLGILLIVTQLGTLDIQTAQARARVDWAPGAGVALAAAALLLGGAVGKSAQLPLQTWLPDAMAGPTPVSALIHSATMVTAGVYLIARTHALFTLAPAVLLVVAAIGAATLLLAGTSALAQHDLKRVLAYSTMSQLGYMFVALGVGAWSAAIFHLVVQAFFKSLLFLAAGAVILAAGGAHDIFEMGGLRRLRLPFWAFVIGAASLAGLPLVTAGFYSKGLILAQAWSSPLGAGWLWAAGVAGAFLTAAYISRVVFVVFFGEPKAQLAHRPGLAMTLPMVVLAALSLTGGLLEPEIVGGPSFLSRFLESALPLPRGHVNLDMEWALEGVVIAAVAGGLAVAYAAYRRGRTRAAPRLVEAGWGFDRLYDLLLVRPYQRLAHYNRNDFVDAIYLAIADLLRRGHHGLSATENGKVRRYAAAIAAGAVLVVAITVLAT